MSEINLSLSVCVARPSDVAEPTHLAINIGDDHDTLLCFSFRPEDVVLDFKDGDKDGIIDDAHALIGFAKQLETYARSSIAEANRAKIR